MTEVSRVPEKVIRGHKIAVLYSPGYGAGWSTWQHDNDRANFVLFDRRLVEAKENGCDAKYVQTLLNDIFGNDIYISIRGWDNVKIKWLLIGTQFRIEEHDGAESIMLLEHTRIHTA